MFISCEFVLSGRGLSDGPIPRPEESYRLWCVFECDQVKIETFYTYCRQVGRRGKDCNDDYPAGGGGGGGRGILLIPSNVNCIIFGSLFLSSVKLYSY
jgi:hypothetical protein